MTQSSTTRLNKAVAAAHAIAIPTKRNAGIVHMGIGAFHRAHQAVYTENAMRHAGGNWHIIGVSLRSDTVAQQLNPQDGLYTIVEESESKPKSKIISAISEVLVAPHDPSKVINCISDEVIHIVTLTITEKGYCHDPASGELDLSHPDIKHDLQNIDAPRTAIGYLVAGIQQRIAKKHAPLTIISCDNLSDNGHLLKQMVLSFAQQIDPQLTTHIEKYYRFPCTMVDRIVPATTPDNIRAYAETLGYQDAGLVVTEPFSQWIIEDKFAGPRPAWDQVGALFVQDVRPFETMKLRLLNGSHSSIAYLGFLANKTFVADVMKVPVLADFVKYIMYKELLPSVEVPDGIDIQQYCQSLLSRFANPSLYHRTQQIAMDGSQKLPQRLLSPLKEHLIDSKNIDSCAAICLVVAAWMQYISGKTLQDQAIDVCDPLAEEFKQIAERHKQAPSYVRAILRMENIFFEELSTNPMVYECILAWFEILQAEQNVLHTLSRFLQEMQDD